MVHGLSHLPIIADPSHGTGHRDMVIPMARPRSRPAPTGSWSRCIPHPDRALSDGAQSLYPEQFDRLMKEVRLIAEAIGRRVAEPAGAAGMRSLIARWRCGAARGRAARRRPRTPQAIVGRSSRVYRSLAELAGRFRAGDRQSDDRQRGEPRHAGAGGAGQAGHALHRSARARPSSSTGSTSGSTRRARCRAR